MLADAGDPDDAYRQARGLSHAAQDQGHSEKALVLGRAAVKIAKLIGYRHGPKEYTESRDVAPTMRIKGDRIVKATPWYNFWD